MNLTFTRFADRFAAAAAPQDPSLLTRLPADATRPKVALHRPVLASPAR